MRVLIGAASAVLGLLTPTPDLRATQGADPTRKAEDPAQKIASPPIHVFWEGSLEGAMQRARRIGRPILVAVHKPSDKASRRMLQQVYASPEVRNLLREFVCVAACADPAPPIEIGPRKGQSSIFGTVTVAEHQAVLEKVRTKYLGDGAIARPQHLFLDADGHLILRKEHFVEAEKFAHLLAELLDRCDPGWRGPAVVEAKQPAAGPVEEVDWSGLFERDVKKRQKAIQRLLRSVDKDLVLSMYKNVRDPETKAMILEGVRRAGAADWALPLVREALADEDATVRAQAAVTAEAAAGAELLSELSQRYKVEKDAFVQRELVRAIGACAHGNKKALQILGKAIRSKDDLVRANAYVAMGVAGGHSKDVASRLADILIAKGLRDRDVVGRSAAVWALGEIRCKRAISAIEKLSMRDRRWSRRGLYRDALRRIQGETVANWDRARRDVAREEIRR